MGAVVTTGKSVSAFKGDDGAVIYVLSEKTYEKNCYPHTPSWCVVGIGTAEEMVKRIFYIGAPCEGHHLQTRRGAILPEKYISGWLKEMASPSLMPNVTSHIKIGGGLRDIRVDEQDTVLSALRSAGRDDIADKLQAGEQIELKLYEDSDVYLALVRTRCVQPWKLLETPRSTEPAPELGYKPARSKETPSISPVEGYRHGEVIFLKGPDGLYRAEGWEHLVMDSFIGSYGEYEVKYPGHYKEVISNYRAQLKALPDLPDTAILVPEIEKEGVSEWQVKDAKKTLDALCHIDSVTFGKVKEIERLANMGQDHVRTNFVYYLTNFCAKCFAWRVPEQAKAQDGVLST